MMKKISIKTIINPYSLIALGVFLFYGRLLFGEMLYTGDIFAYQLPEKFMIRECLLNGNLPIMNPYILSGSPMLNNIAVGALYPLNLLLLIGSPIFGFNLFIFTQLILAGFAIYLFLSRGLQMNKYLSCLGGISYALSGTIWGSIDKGFLASNWLIPIFLLGVIKLFKNNKKPKSIHKSPLIIPSLSLALLFYCGNFMEAYFALLIGGVGVLFYSLFWKKVSSNDKKRTKTKYLLKSVSKYCFVIIIAFLLAAPQLFPTYIASKHSYRAGGINLEEAQHWSLPPSRIIEFLVPFSFGTRAETGFDFGNNAYQPFSKFKSEGTSPWFDSIFFGIPILLGVFLAIFAIFKDILEKRESDIPTGTGLKIKLQQCRISALLLSGAIIFFLLAIGKSFPLYQLLYYILPGFNFFRHPEKFMELTNLFLIVLGVYSLEHFCISRGEEGSKNLRKIVYSTAFLLFLFMITTLILFKSDHGVSEEIYRCRLITISLSILTLGFIALSLSLFKNQIKPLIFSFIAITAIHLIVLSYLTQWTIPQEEFKKQDVWTDGIPEFDRSQWRIFTSATMDYSGERFITKDFSKNKLEEYVNLDYNAPALKKIRTPEGFDALAEKNYVHFFNLRKYSPKRLMDLLSVKYIGSGINLSGKTPAGFKKVKMKNELLYRGTMILENPNALPRISIYKKYLSDHGKNSVFKTDLNLNECFILENDFPVKETKCGENPQLKVLEDSPGEITLQVTGGPAWVVLRDWHCPGWICIDDSGENMPIGTADGGFMAVYADSQSKILKFRFIPPAFYKGLIAAGIGFILLIASTTRRTKQK